MPSVDYITDIGAVGSVDINMAIRGANWLITYTFTNFTPVPEKTILQLTLLEGTFTTPGSTATSLEEFLNGPAQNCDQTKDDLYFFFKDGNTTSDTTIATEEVGTTVSYTDNMITITMPITTPKLNWTNNGAGREYALCCHAKPGGIYLASRIYTKVRLEILQYHHFVPNNTLLSKSTT